MSEAFSADEVLRIAEQIEANGIEFYTAASAQTKDAEASTMLADLAEMELGHKQIFAAMRAELASGPRQEPDPEAMQYLRALAGSRVFDKANASKLAGSESLADILRMAVAAEKDSVTFYVGIVSMLSGPRDRERVNRVIAEEMKHVTMLTGHLNRLPGGQSWSNAE